MYLFTILKLCPWTLEIFEVDTATRKRSFTSSPSLITYLSLILIQRCALKQRLSLSPQAQRQQRKPLAPAALNKSQ